MADTGSPHPLRTSLLRAAFSELDQTQAVGLVGILFEYRVVLAKSFLATVAQPPRHVDIFERLTNGPSPTLSSSANVYTRSKWALGPT